MLDLPALFGRSAPLIVDLGCGNGRFLIGSSVWRPEYDHIGIDVKLNQKEYGAYISTSFYGKFDSMCLGPQTGFQEPDNFLFGQYYPNELKNQSHINDPVVADMLIRQRRTADVAKRREIIHDIQRHLAQQQYYVQLASTIQIAVWEGALKNYGPNVSYDYGARLVSAWLDR